MRMVSAEAGTARMHAAANNSASLVMAPPLLLWARLCNAITFASQRHSIHACSVRIDGEDRMASEFSRRTEALLDKAEAVCGHRGVKLTELRRHVLGLVLDTASPVGAYDLLDRLRQAR